MFLIFFQVIARTKKQHFSNFFFYYLLMSCYCLRGILADLGVLLLFHFEYFVGVLEINSFTYDNNGRNFEYFQKHYKRTTQRPGAKVKSKSPQEELFLDSIKIAILLFYSGSHAWGGKRNSLENQNDENHKNDKNSTIRFRVNWKFLFLRCGNMLIIFMVSVILIP